MDTSNQHRIPARLLALPIFVTLGLSIAWNAALPIVFRSIPARLVQRNLDASPDADALFLGNSLMVAGIDPVAWNENFRDQPGLSLGIGSTQPSEHLLLYRERLRRHGPPEVLVYGFFFLMLSDPDVGSISGNRSLAYFLADSSTIDLYSRSLQGRLRFEFERRVPYIVYQGNLWAQVERARRRIGEIGFARADANSMGRREDFDFLAEMDLDLFAQRLRRATGKPFNPGVERLLSLAESRDCRMVFVLMPQLRSTLEKQYAMEPWKSYISWVREALARRGVELLDASAWIQDQDDFDDIVHLNKVGAKKFTLRLGQYLRDHPDAAP